MKGTIPYQKMKSIVTLTFNPAVDKTVTVERLIPEHKMSVSEPTYYAGGGGVNIVRALHNLGYPAIALYFQGGATGAFFNNLLNAAQIGSYPIKIKGSTRENFVVFERYSGKQYRFGLPGPGVSKRELNSLLNKLTGMEQIDFLVVSGSLAPGISLDIFEKLQAIAKLKNAKLVVDTSGASLKAALNSGVYLIKPSISELAQLVGEDHLSSNQAIKAAKEIIASKKCEVIVISMGRHGAILINKDECITVKAPDVEALSTVGAGDSMLAGILWSLGNDKSYQSALQFGVACGSAATLKHGTGLCDKETADQLYQIIA